MRKEKVIEALNTSGLVQPAGIAISLRNTGQQWLVFLPIPQLLYIILGCEDWLECFALLFGISMCMMMTGVTDGK